MSAGASTLLVTGASGFVGRQVVAQALARGHRVRALVRPSTRSIGPEADGVEVVRADLRSRDLPPELLAGVDAVIHLAATKAGDFYTQFAGTVVGTENLLGAMTEAGVERLVGVSTFSVYDFQGLGSGQLVDEESPLDAHPERRDEYARTKLVQEDLYRQFGAAGNPTVILRPGMIYGPGELWHALLGAELGPVFLRIGSRATLPLCYVENGAEAMVMAAEGLIDNPDRVGGQTLNLVDDHLPTQAQYVELVSAVMEPPRSVPVPWPVMRTMAQALDKANEVVVDGRAKFPGIVVPDRLHARFKPLRYTNARARRVLGWAPRYSTAEAIARSAPAVPAHG